MAWMTAKWNQETAVKLLQSLRDMVDFIYTLCSVLYTAKAFSGVRDYEVYATLMQFRSYRNHLVLLNTGLGTATFESILKEKPIEYRKSTTRDMKNALGKRLSTTAHELATQSGISTAFASARGRFSTFMLDGGAGGADA
jgi:hypothetical protein